MLGTLFPRLARTFNRLNPASFGRPLDTDHPGQWRVDTIVRKYDNQDIDLYRARYGKAEGERRFFESAVLTGETHSKFNLLMYGGASCLFECLKGNGTGTSAQTLTYFNNGNAYLGVGDSTTTEAATQTNLQASSNKVRIAMDSTYPVHTDSATGTEITAATNASPIVLTSTSHGRTAGDVVTVAGVAGNTAANGTWQVSVTDANTLSLNNSSGNGSYTSGGLLSVANVMVFQATAGNSVANYNWNEWGIFNASSGGRMLNRKVVSMGTKVSTATWTLLVALSLA